MQPVTESLWTDADLAAYLGLKAATIGSMASRSPDRLPPRVAAMSLRRWMPEVVRAWAVKQSGDGKRKGGRPRK